MKISNYDFINYLEMQSINTWIDGNDLASYFHTSLKTIFNCAKRINDYCPNLILSSYKGYMINKDIDYDKTSLFFNDNYQTRINYILKKLLSNDRPVIDIYEIADELYVSDSHIEILLKQIRTILNKHNLELYRKRNKAEIIGKEFDIRKFFMFITSKEKADKGMVKTFIYDDVHTIHLMINLSRIIKKYQVKTDDYCFNTICLYYHVAINRIYKNHIIIEDTPDFSSTKPICLFYEIKQFIENEYNITISKSEFYYMASVVSKYSYLFDASQLDQNNIRLYISDTLIQKVESALVALCELYNLNFSNNHYKIIVIIHFQLMAQRISSNFSLKNPLLDRMRKTNTLCYDYALFLISYVFKDFIDITTIEDEISFLGLVLIDILPKSHDKLKCCFIFADYHSIYQKLLDHITSTYSSSIDIVKVISFRELIDNSYDLIITNYPPVQKLTIPFILIDDMQILTNTYEIYLITRINNILSERKLNKFIDNLLVFKSPTLFVYQSNYITLIDAIKKMCFNATHHNYCSSNFYSELISAFSYSVSNINNSTLVTYSITDSCQRPFMSVLINKEPIICNETSVKIIILIGVNKKDKDAFKNIYNTLVSILYSPIAINKLSVANNYNDFFDILISSANFQ